MSPRPSFAFVARSLKPVPIDAISFLAPSKLPLNALAIALPIAPADVTRVFQYSTVVLQNHFTALKVALNEALNAP